MRERRPEGADNEQVEARIFVGPPLSIADGSAHAWVRAERKRRARVTPAEEDEVEFVSPRVPGRMSRGAPREGG